MTINNTTDSARVVEAFDSVAKIFEQKLENDITRRLRQKVYATVQRLVAPGSRILDLNCGIGIDAVALAECGYTVVGLDIAPKMIEEAKQRARRKAVSHTEFFVGSFEDLSPLSSRMFDLVLSNFGGLNCVASLDVVAEQVARAVRPNGYFVAMVMPPVCLWEIVTGVARGNFRVAFRRLRRKVEASGFHGGTFTVHYHSPRAFAAEFRKWFKVKQVRGLSIIAPPPHATRFTHSFPRLTQYLERWEESVAGLPVVRGLGDHFLVILQRIDS
jgi:ubiquinone/menaquinone biosynthesis C-methylase UbiE